MEWVECKRETPNNNDIVNVKFINDEILKAEYVNGDFYEINEEYPGMSGGKLKKSNIIKWRKSNG
jgi:hypothetical protein